jgi:subtilisin-like proprotein convertase family protein
MHAKIPTGLLMLAAGVFQAQADFIESFNPNQSIPAGNPVGVFMALPVTDIPGGTLVSSLTVAVSVGGGYNGGLYAYLVAPNGSEVTLLSQPGATGGNPFGYAGSGLNVTFSDAASASIQTTAENPGSVLSGTFQAAGSLSALNGSPADGTWDLFLADLVAGSGDPTLNNVTLDLPSALASVPDGGGTLLLLGGGLGFLTVFRRRFAPRNEISLSAET